MTQVVVAKVFAAGQKFRIDRRGEWTVKKRTRCFVTISSGLANVEYCKVKKTSDGEEYIVVQRHDVLGRSDTVYASEAIETEVEFPLKAEVTAEEKAEATCSKRKAIGTKAEKLNQTEKPAKPKASKLSRIIEAVKVAKTQKAIEGALSECTKKELHAVLLAVCGEGAEKAPNSMKNVAIVVKYATQIMEKREREAFRALSFEEKYEYLREAVREHCGVLHVLFTLRWSEVQELCRKIGADPNVDREYLPMEILSKIRRTLNFPTMEYAI